jgi:Peptidase family M28
MRVLALTLALLLTAAASAQAPIQKSNPKLPQNSGVIFWKMSPSSVDMLLSNIPQSNTIRLAQLRQTFTDLQCGGSRLREQSFAEGKNLICTLPAASTTAKPGAKSDSNAQPGIILFLAHYEHEGAGQSAVDNWSGAIMLPFLYHALSAAQHRHTFLFAAVDGESGARALYGSFTARQRHAIRGVIALDALGLGPAEFYINPNDSSTFLAWWNLNHQLLHAAADLRVPDPFQGIPGGWFKVDVTREFRHNGIPSILIHSVTFHTRDLPGSAQDTSSAIDRDTYFNTLSLLSDYASELDLMPSAPAGSASPAPSKGRRR